MAEMSTKAEINMREALKVWASTIFSIGFASGVEAVFAENAPTKLTDGGLVVPNRPPLVL